MTKLQNITTELMVDDMQQSIDFYKNIFDFEVVIAQPEEDPFFVMLKSESVELMLYHRNQFAEEISKFKTMPVGGSVALYITVTDIKSLYEKTKNKVKIIQELHRTSYDSTEFSCEDNSGYVLMFSERNN